jgi:peptidoglycan-associated lipoprotein
MTTHLRPLTWILGLALIPACARTRADNSTAEEPSQAAQPASAGSGATTGTRNMTMSGVYLDPELTRLCGMATPRAFFEFDSTVVEGADNSGLSSLARCVSTGPLKGRKLELVGHADPRGTDAYNQQLGKSRAESVMDFLTTEGVSADVMSTRSEGERGADVTTPDEWPYDRRVDIRLVP